MSFPQRCKVCNRVDRVDFNIDDKVWYQVLPKHYAEGVVCLTCFDYFASAKGIGYHNAINEVVFVGEAAHLEYTITGRRNSYKLASYFDLHTLHCSRPAGRLSDRFQPGAG